MKKLLVLSLMLALCAMASATSVTLAVIGGDAPSGEFDPDGQGPLPPIPSYLPSDIIVIGVTADFQVGQISIPQVLGPTPAGPPPASQNPALHALFVNAPVSPGDVVNAGGLLIKDVVGGVNGFDLTDGVPIGEVLWLFEFHVPDAPWSTIIPIHLAGVDMADVWYSEQVTGDIGPLEIHVSPEPMTVALLGLGGLFLRRRK